MSKEPKEESKELSPAESSALFEGVDKATVAVKKAQETLNSAEEKKSAAVKKIHDSLGSGPFEWKGRRVKVTKRGEHFGLKEPKDTTTQGIGG